MAIKARWLLVEESQRRDQKALEVPGIQKTGIKASPTSIRSVAYMDVGKGREQDTEGLLSLLRTKAISGEERLAS